VIGLGSKGVARNNYKLYLICLIVGNVNAGWHEENKMSDCRSYDEKMRWRVEHMKHCSCRMPTAKQLREIEEWRERKI